MSSTVEMSPEDLAILVAENLLKIREFHGVTQNKMAEILKTSQAGYCLSEQAARELSFINLYYLAVHFGYNLNALFNLSDNKNDVGTKKKHLENLSKKDRRKSLFKKKKKTASGKSGVQVK